MTPFALWALSAHAASVDLTHPEKLPARSAERLVDLSAIESAKMTIWFEGPLAPMILGDSGAEALFEYVANRTPGAKKDEALKYAEAARLVATTRFEVQLLNHRGGDIALSVPAIHWGELQGFGSRPDDQAVRDSVTALLSGLGMWGSLHLSADRFDEDESIVRAIETPTSIVVTMRGDPSGDTTVELDRETLLITSMRDAELWARFQYTKHGERYLLKHMDTIVEDKVAGQMDMSFAEVAGVPWPQDIVWRQETIVLPTMHLIDVVLKDDVAPFLAVRATPPAAP